jgi:hypothetical protein
MFAANGDDPTSHVVITTKVLIDPTIVPPGFGLAIEQPAWDPRTRRFVTSVPIIKDNPTGCNYGQLPGAITCDGGLLIINPATLGSGTATIGAFNPTTNVGVLKLQACGPNGASVGVHDNVLLGCTPGNNPSNTSTQVLNLTTKNFANIGNITGSDEVWFNAGDRRYYTASSRNPGGAVLGVIDAVINLLIEKIPQSSGSHSVAADSRRNLIFVPESAAVVTVVPGDPTTIGGDTTAVGAGICGGTSGCIGVYRHKVEDDEHDEDDDHDHNRDRDRR